MSKLKRDIQLIVIDLDGTLLNSKHELSERNKAVIAKAREHGIKVAIATGKTRKGSANALDALNLDTPGVFVQGLMLYNADGTVKQQQTLKPEIARKVIQFSESNGFDVVVYAGDRLLVKRNEPPVSQLTDFHEPEPQGVGALVNIVADTKIHKLMVMGSSMRKLNKLRWQLDKQVGSDVSFTTAAMLTSIEVLPKGASKGNGVRALAKLLDVKAENIMAIGDANNDTDMLEFAGFAVAVGNATDATKEAADEIVGTNDEDGVAEAIEKFVLPDPKPEPEEKASDADAKTEAKSDDSTETEASKDTAE